MMACFLCGHIATKKYDNGHYYCSDNCHHQHARIAELERVARMLVNSLPESEIDLAREVWSNTNADVVLNYRNELAELLK